MHKKWADSPSTLMTPSRCSILTAPQHSRMTATACKLFSLCSSLSMFRLSQSTGNFFFSLPNFQSTLLPPPVRSALTCLSLSLPFYPPASLLPGACPSLHSDLHSFPLPPLPACLYPCPQLPNPQPHPPHTYTYIHTPSKYSHYVLSSLRNRLQLEGPTLTHLLHVNRGSCVAIFYLRVRVSSCTSLFD